MGSAFAYFVDTEVSTANSFEMGTWAVDADGGGNTVVHTFNNLTAGTGGTNYWTVTNTGTVPAYVDMSINVAGTGAGSPGDFLLAHIYVAGYVGDIYGSAASPLPISAAGRNYDLNLVLEGGENLVIALDWTVNDAYEPDAFDEVVFTMSFNIQPAP